jgi:hypothetical protein
MRFVLYPALSRPPAFGARRHLCASALWIGSTPRPRNEERTLGACPRYPSVADRSTGSNDFSA